MESKARLIGFKFLPTICWLWGLEDITEPPCGSISSSVKRG